MSGSFYKSKARGKFGPIFVVTVFVDSESSQELVSVFSLINWLKALTYLKFSRLCKALTVDAILPREWPMLTIKLLLAKLDSSNLLVWALIGFVLISVIDKQLIIGFVIVALEFCQKLVLYRWRWTVVDRALIIEARLLLSFWHTFEDLGRLVKPVEVTLKAENFTVFRLFVDHGAIWVYTDTVFVCPSAQKLKKDLLELIKLIPQLSPAVDIL